MPVDKFGRFYSGSLDKFGRYGIEQASNEIVGKPLETSKDQYSDATIALYDSNNRYSNYVRYTGEPGKLHHLKIPKNYLLYLSEEPVTTTFPHNFTKGDNLRLYKKVDDTSTEATAKVNIKDSGGKIVKYDFIFTFRDSRVFRFLQDSGVVAYEYLPTSTSIFLNGSHIGHTLIGKKLVLNDVLTFHPPQDINSEIFFTIRSPLQNEYKT